MPYRAFFNHESPRRGLEFVTTQGHRWRSTHQAWARRRSSGSQPRCAARLGLRRRYVDAEWRMLQQDAPDDYVIGTGETWSVRQLCETAFGAAGLDTATMSCWTSDSCVQPRSSCSSPTHRGREMSSGGNAGQFQQLVTMMVDADIERHRSGADDARPRHGASGSSDK